MPLGYRLIRALSRLLLRLFYRRVEVVGAERIPPRGPLLVLANHQNALVDGMLLLAVIPRRLRPLAKAPLFSNPLIGPLLRMTRAIPVVRRQDTGTATVENTRMFEAAGRTLAEGGAILIFPEGKSQPEPVLQPLRSGAARLLLGAEAAQGRELDSAVVPVGLLFNEPGTFRSGWAHVLVGEPLRLGETRARRDRAGGHGARPHRADGGRAGRPPRRGGRPRDAAAAPHRGVALARGSRRARGGCRSQRGVAPARGPRLSLAPPARARAHLRAAPRDLSLCRTPRAKRARRARARRAALAGERAPLGAPRDAAPDPGPAPGALGPGDACRAVPPEWLAGPAGASRRRCRGHVQAAAGHAAVSPGLDRRGLAGLASGRVAAAGLLPGRARSLGPLRAGLEGPARARGARHARPPPPPDPA